MGDLKVDIDSLRGSLGAAKVLTPDSVAYSDSIRRWSEAAEKPAAIVVKPTSAEEVSVALQFGRAHDLDVAVVGGGHSTGGTSSTNGGLLIDLSSMRTVSVSANKKTITAQGGALWSDVDTTAAKHGLATVGGTVNHTGIGGLTLGGGYGWLSGKYGLVIDNLLSATVVLADGRIVVTSESSNPDLFWAIRGGGQSFGVAVEFVYRAYEQRDPVWGGLLIFTMDSLETIVTFANKVATTSNGEAAILMGITAPPPLNGAVGIVVLCFYHGPPADAENYFAPILVANPIMNTTGPMPYEALNAMANPLVTHGDRKTMVGSTFVAPLSVSFIKFIIQQYELFISQVPDAIESLILFELFSFKKIIEVEQSATAFANRGEYYNVLILGRWKSKENDSKVRSFARELARQFLKEKERKKVDEGVSLDIEGVGEYGNYDGLGEGSAARALSYGRNFERLVTLKEKYDPQNVFKKTTVFTAAVTKV